MTSPAAPPLTPAQKAKESAVFWAIVLDVGITVFMVFVGVLSGSMTVISEVARIILLLGIEIISYMVLCRAHRGRFKEFEFGIGKIERIVNLMVAFGLCITCLYIFGKLMSMDDAAPLSTHSLFLAVVAADLNLIINVWFTMAFIRANRTESSIIIASQIKSRLAKTVASVIVLLVLMLALWLPDPRSARVVDTLGSIFVLCYMVIIAAGLIKESLPEILDRTVPDPEHFRILRILITHFDRYDGFHGYVVRRSGKDLFIMLTLGFYPDNTLDRIEARLAPLRRDLTSELPGSQVAIIPEIIPDPLS